jgi:uncharacterized surface protein with fasciclin (FAS1) repeats
MLGGKIGSAIPYLRVISETCGPDIDARGQGAPVTLAPGETVRLGVRHMHPLSAAVLHGSPHGRPSLEIMWRVADEGLLLRHMTRELFVFDPSRIKATQIWYAAEGCKIDDFHVVTDSDDMLMLSFAPLAKDTYLYIPDHPVTPIDLARQSLHPLNDNPMTSDFARHRVRLHYGTMEDRRWRRSELRSDKFVNQAVMMREFLRIWSTLEAHGCRRAGELLSVALHATPLARRWRHDGPVSVFVPSDDAIERYGWAKIESLMALGASAQLVEAVLNHTVPQRLAGERLDSSSLKTLGSRPLRLGGASVREAYDVAPHRVFVVDDWITP